MKTLLLVLVLTVGMPAVMYGMGCWLHGGIPRCKQCTRKIPPWSAYCESCLGEVTRRSHWT